jgi:hypothetical protein
MEVQMKKWFKTTGKSLKDDSVMIMLFICSAFCGLLGIGTFKMLFEHSRIEAFGWLDWCYLTYEAAATAGLTFGLLANLTDWLKAKIKAPQSAGKEQAP